ncbi:amphi-Trp domain-containing protein [Halobaculum sp. P14]|uniref:amphi-Trp domain-containing protein n=1 Tax=Halobaculum sp. P14 TaxID=3421638 RepID=UPI003EB77490
MPEEVLFESEDRLDRTDAAALLRDAADRLDDGTVTLAAGDDSLTLDVPGTVDFEVKAERETGAGGADELSVEFELEWHEGDADTDDSPVRIE